MLRQRVLERCGWHFFRIRGYEYFHDKQAILCQLWKTVKRYDSLVLVERPVEEIQPTPMEQIRKSDASEEQPPVDADVAYVDEAVLTGEPELVESLDVEDEFEPVETETPEPPPGITNIGGYFLGSDVTDVQRDWFAGLIDVDWISILKSIKKEDTLFSWEERLLVNLSLYNTTGEEVTGRMIHDLEALTRRVPEIWTKYKSVPQLAKPERRIEPSERQLDLLESVGIGETEVRRMLYAVRDEIHAKWPDVPWERGILRKTMLDKLVRYRVTTMGDFRKVFRGRDLARTHLGQMQFLDRIFAIIKLMC